ncbi:MAG: phage tail tape measure protein, partial [Verrucomicrobiota bacterium]|nr:phage tail tape measure protein [Verrucomicrobiota bacterium]
MKYGLGLILSLNAQNFRAGTRRAAADLKQFGLAGERAFSRLNRAQNRVAANTTKLMAAFSGLYVGVAAIQALTKATKEYDYQLRSLAAIQRGSLKEATKFIEVLYKGNRNLREFSKATVAGAARQLVQAGYSMGQASEGAKLLETSLNAVVASMGALNADQAIQLGINLEKGFGRGQRAATELMDVVSQSINMFPLTMDKVQVALGYATSAAQTYNQDLESTMIAIGALMPVVATASKAGVAYRNTLAGLTKPFTSEQLSERGIRLRDSRGEMRDAMEILFDLDRSLDEDRAKDKAAGTAETETLIHRMFGIRGKALFTAISQLPYTAQNVGALKGIEGIAGMDPRDVYHLLRAATANASGETQRLADAMREAAKIVDQRFAASMENFSENLGAAFLPLEMAFKESIMGITDGLTSLGIGLKDFFTAIGFTKDGLSAMTRT